MEVLPGQGKTYTGLNIIQYYRNIYRDKKVLYLTQSLILKNQAFAMLEDYIDEHVFVSSAIQANEDNFSVVIVDEGDDAFANEAVKFDGDRPVGVINMLRAEKIVVMTATRTKFMERLIEECFNVKFSDICYVFPAKSAVNKHKKNYLLDTRYYEKTDGKVMFFDFCQVIRKKCQEMPIFIFLDDVATKRVEELKS